MRAPLSVMALLSAGCSCSGPPVEWPDVPGARVTAIADDPQWQEAWETAVTRDVGYWNRGMAGVGCPEPFVLGDSGHRIRLVPEEDWGHDGVGITFGGEDGEIRVRAYPDGRPRNNGIPLSHELGHAIGLGHARPEFGPSVMLKASDPIKLERSVPTLRDLVRAACIHECGPCDPEADPYDRE